MDKIELDKDPNVYNDLARMGKLNSQPIYMQLGVHILYKEKSERSLVSLSQKEIESFTNQKVKFSTN